MLITRTLAIVLAAGLLAACSFANPIDEDTTAGRTKVEATFYNPADMPESAQAKPMPEKITWYDGKDKANVSATMDMAKGTVSYSASDVVATDAQEAEARMREALGDDVVESIKAALPDGGLATLIEALGPIVAP